MLVNVEQGAANPSVGTLLRISDALDPVADEALHAAADDLVACLTGLGPGVRAARRLITATPRRSRI
jgi:hypothetical protein